MIGLREVWLISLCMFTFGRMGCEVDPPATLGIHDGKLAECPDRPNCVSTHAEDEVHRAEPISFDGSAEAARAHIVAILESMELVEIVSADGGYIHATARSKTFGFIDDVEFLIDADAGHIHFRSAARLGYGDGDVNRKRMENIRADFLKREFGYST